MQEGGDPEGIIASSDKAGHFSIASPQGTSARLEGHLCLPSAFHPSYAKCQSLQSPSSWSDILTLFSIIDSELHGSSKSQSTFQVQRNHITPPSHPSRITSLLIMAQPGVAPGSPGSQFADL